MSAARPALRVDRARLAHARPGDRARMASALERASPAATGVAERALLLVRRVRVDRPLGAGVEGFAGELIARIRAARASARRGAIGAGESLYFEDETALECAIVAVALGGGPLPELLRRAIPDSATPQLRWRRRILADGDKLPRLIMALVEAGSAGAWLARFDDGELRAAGALLLRSYGSTARLIDASRPDRREAVFASATPPRRPAHIPVAIAEAFALARAATPDRAARLLIAIALLAARRPELVATQALTEALAQGFAPARSPPPGRAVPAMPTLPTAATLGVERMPSARATPRAADRVATGHRQSPPPRGVAPETQPPAATPDGGKGRPAQAGAATAPVETAAAAMAVAPAAIASDHAGLFFLLNIFLALGLYGDFTDPVRRVRGLSPFELMLLLGRRWIGPGFERDPLAPVLRALAGLRARERPGRNFEAPIWQVPPDWLAPWPAGAERSLRRRDGKSLWHAAGFPIADEGHDARPVAALRRRWLACLARYIETRLMRALGSQDRASAVASLLRRHGTVRIDDARVEVAFALDTHPLAIRLAGLDRDPGWIPAAGRSIGFRFA